MENNVNFATIQLLTTSMTIDVMHVTIKHGKPYKMSYDTF